MFVSLLIVVIYLLEKLNCKRLHDTTLVVGLKLKESKNNTSNVMAEKGQSREGKGELMGSSPEERVLFQFR